ncbi:DEGP2, partial [Symbiodinium necroappetens]
VLTQVLAHDLTVGYEELENMLLVSVNGVKVKNLRQVMDIVDTTKDESCDCNEPHWIQQAFVLLRAGANLRAFQQQP